MFKKYVRIFFMNSTHSAGAVREEEEWEEERGR
jgi:hypothetical protein